MCAGFVLLNLGYMLYIQDSTLLFNLTIVKKKRNHSAKNMNLPPLRADVSTWTLLKTVGLVSRTNEEWSGLEYDLKEGRQKPTSLVVVPLLGGDIPL